MKNKCTEQIQTITELKQLQAISAIEWAIKAGTRRVLEDHSEAAGYNRATLGTNLHNLIRDRLDRVFSSKKYDVSQQNYRGDTGVDILYSELSQDEIDSMPKIQPGLAYRSDLNNSPGWIIGDKRFLLQSFKPECLHDIRWGSKSPTKQRVAEKPFNDITPPDDGQSMLDMELPEPSHAASLNQPTPTLIIAYSVDEIQNKIEAAIGRSRYVIGERNPKPWHWVELIKITSPSIKTAIPSDLTSQSNDLMVDPPVRLRKLSDEKKHKQV